MKRHRRQIPGRRLVGPESKKDHSGLQTEASLRKKSQRRRLQHLYQQRISLHRQVFLYHLGGRLSDSLKMSRRRMGAKQQLAENVDSQLERRRPIPSRGDCASLRTHSAPYWRIWKRVEVQILGRRKTVVSKFLPSSGSKKEDLMGPSTGVPFSWTCRASRSRERTLQGE